MRRVYPAYARKIAEYIQRGQPPIAVGVLMGRDWGGYTNVPRACVKPDEWALGRFEFGWLVDQHAVAIVGDGVYDPHFAELLVEMMLAGPRLLWVVTVEGQWLSRGDDVLQADRILDLVRAMAKGAKLSSDLLLLARGRYMAGLGRAADRYAKRLDRMIEAGATSLPRDWKDDVARRFGNPWWSGDARAA